MLTMSWCQFTSAYLHMTGPLGFNSLGLFLQKDQCIFLKSMRCLKMNESNDLYQRVLQTQRVYMKASRPL